MTHTLAGAPRAVEPNIEAIHALDDLGAYRRARSAIIDLLDTDAVNPDSLASVSREDLYALIDLIQHVEDFDGEQLTAYVPACIAGLADLLLPDPSGMETLNRERVGALLYVVSRYEDRCMARLQVALLAKRDDVATHPAESEDERQDRVIAQKLACYRKRGHAA